MFLYVQHKTHLSTGFVRPWSLYATHPFLPDLRPGVPFFRGPPFSHSLSLPPPCVSHSFTSLNRPSPGPTLRRLLRLDRNFTTRPTGLPLCRHKGWVPLVPSPPATRGTLVPQVFVCFLYVFLQVESPLIRSLSLDIRPVNIP